MLFQNHIFFGSKLKAPCTCTSATTGHQNHWKELGSGSRFFDWAPLCTKKIPRSWEQPGNGGQTNYTYVSKCIEIENWLANTRQLRLGDFVMSSGFPSAFLYLLTGFSNEHKNNDSRITEMVVQTLVSSRDCSLSRDWCVLLPQCNAENVKHWSPTMALGFFCGQCVESACIASLDWTCAMFSLLNLRTYVYLTGAMDSQSIALCHITASHSVIILTVHTCLRPAIYLLDFLSVYVSATWGEREVISVRLKPFVFLLRR